MIASRSNPRCPNRIGLFVLLLLLIRPITTFAEVPEGLAGIAWGTSPAKVRQALKGRCQFSEPLDADEQI